MERYPKHPRLCFDFQRTKTLQQPPRLKKCDCSDSAATTEWKRHSYPRFFFSKRETGGEETSSSLPTTTRRTMQQGERIWAIASSQNESVVSTTTAEFIASYFHFFKKENWTGDWRKDQSDWIQRFVKYLSIREIRCCACNGSHIWSPRWRIVWLRRKGFFLCRTPEEDEKEERG